MATYEVEYKQTARERYDTDANDRARAVIDSLGLTVRGSWGGTDLTTPEDELGAENGFDLDLTPEQVETVREALSKVLDHPETLTIRLLTSEG